MDTRWFSCILVLVVVGLAHGVSDVNITMDLDTQDAGEDFLALEKSFKVSVQGMMKKLMPYLLKGGNEAQISGQCLSSMMRVFSGVRQIREWAMRFLDATGKIPPGLLEGTSLSIGDYDECLDIEVGRKDEIPKTPEEVRFRGKYCLLEAHRPDAINRAIEEYRKGNMDTPIAKTKTFFNMFIRYKHLRNSTFKLGICVPSKCSKEDVERIFSGEMFKFAGKITVPYCKVKGEEEAKSADQIFLLCLFGFVIALLVIATVIDAVLRFRGEECISKASPATKYLCEVSKGLSLYSSAVEVMDTSKVHESIRCLCGIRSIIVFLTIYSHTYGHIHKLHFQKFSKAANFLKFFESFTFSGIANGSVGMDTIVFLSAITITYNRWKNVSDKSKVKLNVVKLFLERYCRMTAAQLLAIGVFLFLAMMGSGPIWNAYIDPMVENCRERWWLNVVYITNCWNSTKVCLYHTWVLAVIMQLTIVSIFILWILKISRNIGILFMLVLVLSGTIAVGVMTVIHDLPGGLAYFMLDERTAKITWREIFILPYDHIGPFCTGLLSGYFLAIKKNQLNISRVTSGVLWCIAISCNIAVMFGLYDYRHGEKMALSLSTFYAIMHRNVWGLSLAWLVIACSTHHGGPVARVLHSNFFLTTDRLCYMAFLIHLPIMFYHSGSLRERWFMGHLEITMLAIAYIITSFLASFFLYIIFVKPYIYIEERIVSCINSQHKMSFDIRKFSKNNTTPSVANGDATNATCVNVGYSKNEEEL